MDGLGEEVAIIVVEELSSSEELLSRTSEVLLDVLTSDSLEDAVDTGVTELVATSLDADENDEDETLVSTLVEGSVVALLDSELLSVSYWDVVLLALEDWTEDVVDGELDVEEVVIKSDVEANRDELLSVELEESVEVEELTSGEGRGELLCVSLNPDDDELAELEVEVGTVTCALGDVVVCRVDDDEATCELELALLVLATKLELDTKRVLL